MLSEDLDALLDKDRLWFDQNPGRKIMVRLAVEGEFVPPAGDTPVLRPGQSMSEAKRQQIELRDERRARLEQVRRDHPDWRAYTIVVCVKKGFRFRSLFVAQEPPFIVQAWPEEDLIPIFLDSASDDTLAMMEVLIEKGDQKRRKLDRLRFGKKNRRR